MRTPITPKRILESARYRGGELLRYRRFLRKPYAHLRRPIEVARRRRLGRDVTPSDRHVEALGALERTGFCRIDHMIDTRLLDELESAVAQQLSGSQRESGRAVRNKAFLTDAMPRDAWRADSPFVRYALQPEITSIATAYLGEVPVLYGVALLLSSLTGEGGWKVSQRWHRDYEDSRMVKLFTYFSDVDRDSQGPLTFIPADVTSRLGLPVFPVHKSDATMERAGGAGEEVRVVGPRRTCFLIDNHRCFHLGSRITEDYMRIAYQATYISSTPYVPLPSKFTAGKETLSPVDNLILRIDGSASGRP